MKRIVILIFLFLSTELNAQITDTSLMFNNLVVYAAYDSPMDATWRERRPTYCWTWENFRDSIWEIQTDHFVQHIFNPVMNNPDVPKENLEFLKRLKFYLEDTEYHAFDGPDPFIMPVFQAYDPEDENYYIANVSIDSAISKTYFVSSLSSTRKAIAIGPSTYCWINTCAEWPCKLKKNNWFEEFSPIIATPFKIELEFGTNPEIDSLLSKENTAEWECTFCRTSDLQTTFATLKGVPGLYFAYSSGVQSTRRSIVMKIGNNIAFLWTFTCSCK